MFPSPDDPALLDPAVARALLAVARLAHAEVERAGLLTDDAPALAMAVVARWCVGAASVEEVREAAAELYGPHLRAAGASDEGRRGAMERLRSCVACVTAYVTARGYAREGRRSSGLEWAVRCLVWLGEERAAAEARVWEVYAAALP